MALLAPVESRDPQRRSRAGEVMNAKLGGGELPIPEDQVGYLMSTAARAPSVHNTQPWRFRVNPCDIELFADPGRKLRGDPLGQET
jgi:hypothetical protein